MTTLTTPAQPEARLRPVPWRRMAWVTWRQHRVALAGVVAALCAMGLYLLKTGLDMRHAFAAFDSSLVGCHPPASAACQQSISDFATGYATTAANIMFVAALLQAAPALIGVFTGAPVLAREFEAGTFRYSWTQGFGRARWAVAKLGLVAVAVTAVAFAFSLVYSWCYQPIFDLTGYDPLDSTTFDLRGVAFAAWTLAAFAIGVAAGVLIRRVVPAMAATLAAWTALALAAGMYLRRHYEAPLVTGNPNVAHSAWVFSQWWTRSGKPVNLSAVNQALQGVPGGNWVSDATGTFGPVQWRHLIQHGFTQWTSYQPASRFWQFQWIEGGWLLVLSLLLIAATIWLVRRRAA